MIRAKISLANNHITIEWVDVVNNQIIKTVGREEVNLSRTDSSYISRAEFASGTMQPGTFWVDGNGLRHFFASADAGYVPLSGVEVEMD